MVFCKLRKSKRSQPDYQESAGEEEKKGNYLLYAVETTTALPSSWQLLD